MDGSSVRSVTCSLAFQVSASTEAIYAGAAGPTELSLGFRESNVRVNIAPNRSKPARRVCFSRF